MLSHILDRLHIILDRLPYIGRLWIQLRNISGHYSSPIPKHKDILKYLEFTKTDEFELSDIDLNTQNQFKLLTTFQAFYDDLPFPEKKSQECRYYYDQTCFCYADAIFLYSFLRHANPKRIIEVGSGFSSAVILDTAERFLVQQPKITFIDPYPDRLRQLLRPQDEGNITIVKKKVQEVPIDTFLSLHAGDLIFIDSSHVIKCGSDLQFLMFQVLPRLRTGVFIHFHDVFYPFEYPAKWLLKGIYWNEDYFLRAFLAYNSEWHIYFFNTYVASVFKDYLLEKMPLCLKNAGGSIYIQRVEKD
jgi:predicted O-methyltransferase YrrM